MHEVINQFFDFDTARPYFSALARGFLTTLEILALAEIICLILGMVLAVMRRFRVDSRRPAPARAGAWLVRFAAVCFINVFRGLPALLVIVLMWAAFPFLPFPVVSGLTDFQIGFIGLGIVYAAYVAEVYRAGIDSVEKGQVEAARSLGMSSAQAMRLVVLPQAVRRVLPPLMNDFIALSKDVALLSVIAVPEVLYQAKVAQAETFNATTITIAGAFYLLFTLPLIWALDRVIARQEARTGRRAVPTP
jgi:polar amino acid transport system permease protein